MSVWWGVSGVAIPFILFLYAYIAYPLMLWVLASARNKRLPLSDPSSWPRIAITIPCYNEERRLGAALDAILAADYPADRREIVVVSDASSDSTDEIARSFSPQGVLLIRLSDRRGKTAAEHAGIAASRGEIVINLDASVLVEGRALKNIVRAFSDAAVGVASSRDVSVNATSVDGNRGESGYVDYEMRVRALETRLYSIVGASGSFFAMRRELHQPDFPESLSRDFASALMAVEQGYRAVSVDDAICYVPRTRALGGEYHRKVRTMARGLQTLWYKRHLMNPARYGLFSWMLISHKLCRWLTSLTLPFAVVGALMIAQVWQPIWLPLAIFAFAVLLGILGIKWPSDRRPPSVVAIPGFALASNLACIVAWMQALGGRRRSSWEPTRREGGRRGTHLSADIASSLARSSAAEIADHRPE